jgi:PAS domain S-box-containing protein
MDNDLETAETTRPGTTDWPIRVLCADDNQPDRQSVRDVLEKQHQGFELTEAASRDQFQSLLAERAFDVVLSDFNIFGYEGLQAIDAVRGASPATPVIILTAKGCEEVAVEALKRGAADYVVKTSEHFRCLPQTILAALRAQRLKDQQIAAGSALRESHTELQTIYEGMSDGLLVVDAQTRQFVQANSAICEMLQYSQEELLKMCVADVHPAGALPQIIEQVEAQIEGRQFVAESIPFLRKDGSVFLADVTGRPIEVQYRGRPCVVGFIRDTTERRRAEEALREQKEILETILDNAPIMTAFLDSRGKHRWVNRCWEQTLGWSLAEAQSRDVLRETYPDPEYYRYVVDFIRQSSGAWGNFKTRRRDGTVIDTCWANVRLSDGSNIGIGHDVTEQKRAEEALQKAHDQLEERVKQRTAELADANRQLQQEVAERRRAEERIRLDEARLEALLHLSQMSSASFDEIANHALEQGIKLTGSSIGFLGLMNEDESVYTVHAFSNSVTEACKADNPLQRRIAEAGLWADAVRQRKTLVVNDYAEPCPSKKGLPKGHAPIQRLMVVPVFENEKIVAVVGVGNKASHYDNEDQRHLTLLMSGTWGYAQRNQAEEALRKVNQQLKQEIEDRKRTEEALRRAQRLASIGTLAAGIAHEINNPLSAIAAYTQAARLLKDRPEGGKTLDDSLREIEKQVFRCNRIVKSVLQFSRDEESQKWPCDLGEVARRAQDLTRQYAEENHVSIRLELSGPLPEVEIDPTEMEQVFVNLIRNAVEASQPGGQVTVRIEPQPDALRVLVEDQGRGMPQEEAGRVFDPFYTTRQQQGGTGLGLSVTHGIIQHHGGTMDVQSTPGQGTTMTFTLPLKPAHATS